VLVAVTGCEQRAVESVESRAEGPNPAAPQAATIKKRTFGDEDAYHAIAHVSASGELRVDCVRGREAARRNVESSGTEAPQ
jgi:hypothetical protein